MTLYVDLIIDERWSMLYYPGIMTECYMISDHGQIYSFLKNRNIEPANHSQGYKHITLIGDDGKYKKVLVHRLVAWHFVAGRTKEKIFVNHKDGRKSNNYYKNLEWSTHQYNVSHAVETGLNNCAELFKEKYKGSNNPNSKYSDQVIERICELLEKGLKTKDIVSVIIEEYSSKEYSKKSLNSYIKTKIKPRLLRTEISYKYKF